MIAGQTIYGMSLAFWSLLLAFALSLVAAALLLLRLCLRSPERAWWLEVPCRFIAVFVAVMLSVDTISCTSRGMSDTRHYLLSVLAVASSVAVAAFCRPLSALSRTSHLMSGLAGQVLLMAICLGTAYWSGHRFYLHTVVTLDLGLFSDTPGALTQVSGQILVTDHGQQLPLFRWDVDHDAFEYYASLSTERWETLRQPSILRAPPDARANCHGWVFTGGKFLLRGREVGEILKDNGYQVVDHPQANDLVIYRDSDGEIVHTGLVRGVFEEGTVMVESKWGIDGRYLHKPENQPYSSHFSYYRSPRQGHLVNSVAASGPAAATAPTSSIGG